MTSGRLRAADLATPFRGVRTPVRLHDPAAAHPDDPGARDDEARAALHERARAYSLVMPAGAFFTAATAAALHGAPIDATGALEVGVLTPARAPRGRGIRAVSVAPHLVSVRTVDGIPLASPASAWAALACSSSVRRLVIVGDALVHEPRGPGGVSRPGSGATTPTQLAAVIAAGRRPGVARLRAALELIRVGSSSPRESELRLDLRESGMPEPELDVEIRDDRGHLLGISELVYPERRLVVEVEGEHHRTSRRQWNRDIEKYADYAAAGWHVVRVTGAHIRTGRAARLVQRAWDTCSPSGGA